MNENNNRGGWKIARIYKGDSNRSDTLMGCGDVVVKCKEILLQDRVSLKMRSGFQLVFAFNLYKTCRN